MEMENGMKKKNNIKSKSFFITILTALFILTSLWFLQRLLMPKYMGQIVEGALIAEYYEETTKHDVIFIGDCEVYENISPITLWEEYGITSYIRGSAQQLIWQSYYLLEETLKIEKPKVVVFNVLAMQYNEPQKEAYNRMTIDGMRWSEAKVKNIQASMMEDEKFLDYVFPLLRYHSRWQELNKEDFIYLFDKKKVSHNGYYMRVDVKPVTGEVNPKKLANYQFGENAYAYLDKMTTLCKDNDIQLILIKAPSTYPYWYEEWEVQMEEYAKEHDLAYYNFLELTEQVGLDYQTDTYDAGLHLNLSGAEKMARYFGTILREEFQIPDHRGEAEYEKVWEEKVEFYNQERERQKRVYGIIE